MEDQSKIIKPVTYEKVDNEKFIIGISLNDTKSFIEIGKLVEKGIAQNMGLYQNNKVHYISKQKLS
jgi:hypothetical protein